MMVQPRAAGWIEVICGPMFSGKTEELIRRLRRAEIAQQKVQIFKPSTDDRYSKSDVVSHDAQRIGARPVACSGDILALLEEGTAVVGVDEAQFFDAEIVQVLDELARRGVRVVVAGLDTDYRSLPFEPMPALMAAAEYVTKLMAICLRCGSPANRTLRHASNGPRVEVGAAERYTALCRRCYAEASALGAQPRTEEWGDAIGAKRRLQA
ncbi:MAG: thymidine kinase [Deltaproteobacteria bacterium]|nr:thymidine kinase [Deltaproteobacteria bacterium]